MLSILMDNIWLSDVIVGENKGDQKLMLQSAPLLFPKPNKYRLKRPHTGLILLFAVVASGWILFVDVLFFMEPEGAKLEALSG